MDPESSTPESERQVTAMGLRQWASDLGLIGLPEAASVCKRAASALEARDATIVGLRAELKKAKARRVPDGWFGQLTHDTDETNLWVSADGTWNYFDEAGNLRYLDGKATAEEALAAALVAAEAEGGDYYPDRYNTNLDSPSIASRIGSMDPKPATAAETEEVRDES